MTVTLNPVLPPAPTRVLPEQRVILHNASWETYERLLSEHDEDSGKHFAFDQGTLEIMVLSAEHENYSDILALLVNTVADEMEIDVNSFGSTTFQREDLLRGFEPDACFYIHNEARVRGKKRLDLRVDPPPDLVIEVDITSPSLNKFPIFAALGVPEVWRYDGERVSIFCLRAGGYTEQAASTMLPKVTGAVLTEFVQSSQQVKRREWLRTVRTWAQHIVST